MREVIVGNSQNAAWDEYVMRHPAATLYHLSGWRGAAVQSYGARDLSLMCKVNGEVRGILPLLKVRGLRGSYITSGIFGSYEGILSDSEEIRDELLKEAMSVCDVHSCAFLVIKESEPVEYQRFRVANDYVTFVLDLSGGIETLWRTIGDKTRNQVRKAQRAGITVTYESGGLSEFTRVYSRCMRDMGTPYLGNLFFLNLCREFREQSKIFLVKMKSKTIGAGIAFIFKGTAYTPFYTSLKKYKSFCPNNVFFWDMIQSSCRQGCRWFDFGRSTVHTGNYSFKKQWGAVARPLYYNYYLKSGRRLPTFNPHDAKYKVCSMVWRKVPVTLANFFGPSIIKGML